MPTQFFRVTRAPEAKEITPKEIKHALMDIRSDTEWDVKEFANDPRPAVPGRNEAIMITNKHLAMVADELKKAKQKHPFFAGQIAPDLVLRNATDYQDGFEKQLDLEVKNNHVNAMTVFECEYWEALEAYAKSNYAECLRELAQCVAVLFRTMDMVAEKLKKGDNSEPDNN